MWIRGGGGDLAILIIFNIFNIIIKSANMDKGGEYTPYTQNVDKSNVFLHVSHGRGFSGVHKIR